MYGFERTKEFLICLEEHNPEKYLQIVGCESLELRLTEFFSNFVQCKHPWKLTLFKVSDFLNFVNSRSISNSSIPIFDSNQSYDLGDLCYDSKNKRVMVYNGNTWNHFN